MWKLRQLAPVEKACGKPPDGLPRLVRSPSCIEVRRVLRPACSRDLGCTGRHWTAGLGILLRAIMEATPSLGRDGWQCADAVPDGMASPLTPEGRRGGMNGVVKR
jgi:hypothetical protein